MLKYIAIAIVATTIALGGLGWGATEVFRYGWALAYHKIHTDCFVASQGLIMQHGNRFVMCGPAFEIKEEKPEKPLDKNKNT